MSAALWWGIGAGALLLGGIAIFGGGKDVLAETGSVPEPSGKKVPGRNGKTLEGQSKKVLRWAPKIRTAILANENIPEDERVRFLRETLAFIQHESGGNPTIASYERTGVNNASGDFVLDASGNKKPLAVGLGQFIAGTAKSYGIKDRKDPDQMIPGMIRFIFDLYKKSGGNSANMAQGYYSGIGNAARDINAAIKKQEALKAQGRKNSLASKLNIKKYMDYHMRLLDLYGDVT